MVWYIGATSQKVGSSNTSSQPDLLGLGKLAARKDRCRKMNSRIEFSAKDTSPMHGSPGRAFSILRVVSLEEYARAGQLGEWPGRAGTFDNRRHVCVVFRDFTAGTDKA
jgi:hypothetical protein